MKSEKAKDLLNWLKEDVRLKNYKPEYIEELIEISELENSDFCNEEILEKRVNDFKRKFDTSHNVWFDIL